MNKDELKGNWKQAKGKIKKQWGKLTDDEIDKIDGDYDRLVGTIQKRYGKNKEESRDKVDSFLNDFNKH